MSRYAPFDVLSDFILFRFSTMNSLVSFVHFSFVFFVCLYVIV